MDPDLVAQVRWQDTGFMVYLDLYVLYAFNTFFYSCNIKLTSDIVKKML